MPKDTERRRARRIAVNIPTAIEVVGHHDVELHANLARVYERVTSNPAALGKRFPASIRDLSTNGMFITGDALPLLSRVIMRFELDDFGSIDALGWILWRRSEDCEVPRGSGTVTLPRGFGVLFEAIPLDARLAIHELVGAAPSIL
jgi:hypothetical protein